MAIRKYAPHILLYGLEERFGSMFVSGEPTPYCIIVFDVYENDTMSCSLLIDGKYGPIFPIGLHQVKWIQYDDDLLRKGNRTPTILGFKIDVTPELISTLDRVRLLLGTLEALGFCTKTPFLLNTDDKWEIDLLVGIPQRELLTYVEGTDMVSSIEIALDQAQEEGWDIPTFQINNINKRIGILSSVGLFNKE